MREQELIEREAVAHKAPAPRHSTANEKLNTEQGHWLLAKMGKKVLRPGGKELTLQLMGKLAINPQDDVVEFAPGLGYTAGITLAKKPRSYTGVELNEEAAGILRRKINGPKQRIVIGNACCAPLETATADKLYAEAMLTMQTTETKRRILNEAYRILEPGGRYGIHELSLSPDDIPDTIKHEIEQALSHSIRVGARPLTCAEWREELTRAGFEVREEHRAPMHLLEPMRLVRDEGWFGAMRFLMNVVRDAPARKRVLQMRSVFRRYEANLGAISLIGVKTSDR